MQGARIDKLLNRKEVYIRKIVLRGLNQTKRIHVHQKVQAVSLNTPTSYSFMLNDLLFCSVS